MSYLDFFRLQAEPFSNAPNERFYYNSAQHARALTRIMYIAETMKGLGVVVGDIGTGKTTLARKVLDSLPDEIYESALLIILHSEISSEWLLRKIASQIGVQQPAREKIQIIAQLYRRLMELHETGKRAVVLIDEAQMLNSKDLMEEFRGLLNLEVTAHKLITFIFFGLPEMEQNLQLDPPLLQRMAMKIRLSTLTEEATKAYVIHRMSVAGNRDEIFTGEALTHIYNYSTGIPRKINVLCDNALFQGFLMRQHRVDADIVLEMASDLGYAPGTVENAVISSDTVPSQWVSGEDGAGAMDGIAVDEVGPGGGDASEGPAAGHINPEPSDNTTEDMDAEFEEFFEETFKGDK